jgi:hypothetical protein
MKNKLKQIKRPDKKEQAAIERVRRLKAYGATGKFKKKGIFNRGKVK